MQIVRALSRAGGRGRVLWTCFRKLRTSSPSIAYNMRHYVMNTRMPRVHTQVCTSAAHLRSNRPLLHPTRWWNVLRTRPRLNANTLNLTKIRWHSANRLKLFEESIRKARFEGFAFVASLLEKKGGDEGGEAFENLESTQQWLFVRLTRPSLETIPREPYTSFALFIHPAPREIERANDRPLVQVCRCASDMHNFFHSFFHSFCFLLLFFFFSSLCI